MPLRYNICILTPSRPDKQVVYWWNRIKQFLRFFFFFCLVAGAMTGASGVEGAAAGGGWPSPAAWIQRCRESRRLVLVIVAIALLLDNMLLTTVGKAATPFSLEMREN